MSNEKVETFLWEHRENGCTAIAGDELDEFGLSVNIGWQDNVTGEKIFLREEDSYEYLDAVQGAGRWPS